jgi:ribosomal protein S21
MSKKHPNAEVSLNGKKSLDKAYFEKALNKFGREFLKSGVLDVLRLKRCHYKPSKMRRVKKELSRNKWKFYN